METCLIEVPYMAGDDRHPAAVGPRRLAEAAATSLESKGVGAVVRRVDRNAPFGDSASASFAVCRGLAAAVREAVAAGRLPIVLAGSCDASKGVLAGLAGDRPGVVWVDAHGDFNTPDSTVTGFFPGMSLAVIAGHCYRDPWARIGNAAPVPEPNVIVLGARDLDPAERERFARSAIRVVEWRDGEPIGDVAACLDALAERVGRVYLHIDLDAVDPEFAPGVVDHPVPGGLSTDQLEGIVEGVAARFRVAAATLATYTPAKDRDDLTLNAALRVIDRLVGGAGEG